MLLTILTLLEKRKGTILFIGGIIVGLILGLIFAWGLWPVQWKNASPGHLRSDFQQQYINAVADAYNFDRNIEAAREKLGLNLEGKNANPWVSKPETFQQAMQGAIAQAENETRATALGRLSQDLGVDIGQPEVATPVPEGEEATPAPEDGEGGGSSFLTILGALLIVIALVAAAFFGITRFNARRKKAEDQTEGASMAGAYGTITADEEAVETEETTPPLSSFVATYVLGDDFFDPSYSIEVGNDFLGECGVGISESIGVGDPKKVTALEAWLFDKSDIRTVTHVLASEYAYNDPSLSAKLAGKGEIIKIEPGQEVVLETTALRVTARVKEVEYAQGDLPNNSFFQKASIELRAWVKSGEDSQETE